LTTERAAWSGRLPPVDLVERASSASTRARVDLGLGSTLGDLVVGQH
jgi:hypothetical protein